MSNTFPSGPKLMLFNEQEHDGVARRQSKAMVQGIRRNTYGYEGSTGFYREPICLSLSSIREGRSWLQSEWYRVLTPCVPYTNALMRRPFMNIRRWEEMTRTLMKSQLLGMARSLFLPSCARARIPFSASQRVIRSGHRPSTAATRRLSTGRPRSWRGDVGRR